MKRSGLATKGLGLNTEDVRSGFAYEAQFSSSGFGVYPCLDVDRNPHGAFRAAI